MAQPDDRRISKWYDSLAGLENGEAWVWHPEAPVIFERIQFRKRETLHATREYFRQAEFEQKDVRLMDVDSFVQRFKKVFEPASKAPVPVPMKQEVIPERPIIAQRPIPPPALKPISEESPSEPEPETKELASFTLEVTRLQTPTLAAKVIFILKKLGRQVYPKEIIATALEYGWVINAQNFGRDIKPTIQDGLIMKNDAGFLYLPSQIKFEEVPA